MRNQFNTSFKFTKESSFVGGIQLSKGMLWAKMKREEEAKNTKVVNRIFSNQAPAHSNTKRNQPVITSSSQRPSVKGNDSWTSTPRTVYQAKPNVSPRESFRSSKTNFELIDTKESKLMKLSKKITKYEPPKEPLYKAPVKRLAKGVVKQPPSRPITTSTFIAPVIPPVATITPKITKKVFKEDVHANVNVKKNVFVQNQPVFREQKTTNMVSKSFDFKTWGNMQHENSYKEPAPSNKYRGAMRARKVPCETLKYKSVISRKEHKFKCFKEKDLGIPKQFCNKIIHHTVDNDCYTDDEQLGLAVKNLYFSLRLATEEIDV